MFGRWAYMACPRSGSISAPSYALSLVVASRRRSTGPRSPTPTGGALGELLFAFDDAERSLRDHLEDGVAAQERLHLGMDGGVGPVLRDVGGHDAADGLRIQIARGIDRSRPSFDRDAL